MKVYFKGNGRWCNQLDDNEFDYDAYDKYESGVFYLKDTDSDELEVTGQTTVYFLLACDDHEKGVSNKYNEMFAIHKETYVAGDPNILSEE